MNRGSRWSRLVFAALLSFMMLGISLVPTRSAGAVGCGNATQPAAPAVQSHERWRYVYDGGGNYEVVAWTPTEVTLLIDAPGCALSRIALVGLDLLSGQERWRITSDQWEGDANMGINTSSGLVILPTSKAVYAYDETTGQQLWSAASNYDWAANIVANENNVIVLSYENSLMALNEGTGALLWQQMLPVMSITDWQNIDGGPLVGIGRPETGGQAVQVFGIDKNSGMLLWQTEVGQTISSTGGQIDLDGNGLGLMAATVLTDGTSSLVAIDGTSGLIRWSAPLANDGSFGNVYLTNGAQPAVIYATGGALDVKSATGYDAVTGAMRWQNQNIGFSAILVDDTHLIGAGPTLSYMNALVSVDGETGTMVWSQPYALVDDGFFGSANISGNELIFTPSLTSTTTPTVMGVDFASGNIDWSNAYPEFIGLYVNGNAGGLTLATGDTTTEAVLMALAP